MRAVRIGSVLSLAGALTLGHAAARADEAALAGSGQSGANLARPLFSPTRRPPPPMQPLVAQPVVEAPAPPAPPPSVSLSGVILGGTHSIALLQRPPDPSTVRVALGGEVDGWTVAEIRQRALVLRQGARTVTIDLPGPTR